MYERVEFLIFYSKRLKLVGVDGRSPVSLISYAFEKGLCEIYNSISRVAEASKRVGSALQTSNKKGGLLRMNSFFSN